MPSRLWATAIKPASFPGALPADGTERKDTCPWCAKQAMQPDKESASASAAEMFKDVQRKSHSLGNRFACGQIPRSTCEHVLEAIHNLVDIAEPQGYKIIHYHLTGSFCRCKNRMSRMRRFLVATQRLLLE